MLVLSRRVWEEIVIEDVVLRITRIREREVDLTLCKINGRAAVCTTLELYEPIDACYDCRLVLIKCQEDVVRLGIESPESVAVHRREMMRD